MTNENTDDIHNQQDLGVLTHLVWPLAAGLALIEIHKLNAPHESAHVETPEELKLALSFLLGYFTARGVRLRPPGIPIIPAVELDLSRDLTPEKVNAVALAEAYRALIEADKILSHEPPFTSCLQGAIDSLFNRAAEAGGGEIAA